MNLLFIFLNLIIYSNFSSAIMNYTIKPNDTCYDIINNYKIYNETFYNMNININCDNLLPYENVTIIGENTIIIDKQSINNYINNIF